MIPDLGGASNKERGWVDTLARGYLTIDYPGSNLTVFWEFRTAQEPMVMDEPSHFGCQDAPRMRVISWSFFANVGFVLLKGVVGVLAGSEALVADALHSLTDMASLGINYTNAQAKGDEPRDKLIGLNAITTVLMFVAGLGIVGHALALLASGQLVHPAVLAPVVALVSTVANACLYLYSKRVHNQSKDSHTLLCVIQNRTNFFSSCLALAGISLAEFGFMSFDPICAILIGILMSGAAFEIFKETSTNRMPSAVFTEQRSLVAVCVLSCCVVAFYAAEIHGTLSRDEVVLIPSSGPTLASPVDDLLGRARYFIVVNIDRNSSTVIPNTARPYPGDVSNHLLGIIEANKVNVVLASKIGKEMYDDLRAADVKMHFIDNRATVQDILVFHQHQRLALASGPNVGKGYGRGTVRWLSPW